MKKEILKAFEEMTDDHLQWLYDEFNRHVKRLIERRDAIEIIMQLRKEKDE